MEQAGGERTKPGAANDGTVGWFSPFSISSPSRWGPAGISGVAVGRLRLHGDKVRRRRAAGEHCQTLVVRLWHGRIIAEPRSAPWQGSMASMSIRGSRFLEGVSSKILRTPTRQFTFEATSTHV
jgi:hypothetical protein